MSERPDIDAIRARADAAEHKLDAMYSVIESWRGLNLNDNAALMKVNNDVCELLRAKDAQCSQ